MADDAAEREVVKGDGRHRPPIDEVTSELASLDLLNLALARQRQQLAAAFDIVTRLHQRVAHTYTVDGLYASAVKAVRSDLGVDCCAILRMDLKNKQVHLLASEGMPEGTQKQWDLCEEPSAEELMRPTFVSSSTNPRPFDECIRKTFLFPYFVWHPIGENKDGITALFAGNTREDLMVKHPFSDINSQAFAAIASAISLRRENIEQTQELVKQRERKIEFLAEILRTAVMSVVVTDERGRIIYVNPATEKLFGYTSGDLSSKETGILNAESNASEIQKEIMDTVLEGRVWKGELLNKKKDGTVFPVRVAVYRLPTGGEGGVTLVGFQEDITEERRSAERLLTYQASLRKLASELSLAEERTRRRIASDLHDCIAQPLVNCRITLGALREALPSTGRQTLLDKVRESLGQAIQDVRSLTFELSSPLLYDVGLEAAVEQLAEATLGRHDIRWKLEDDGTEMPLMSDIRIILYQAVRELLNNIIKHAQARTVHVSICSDETHMRVCVRDDGIGFDTSKAESHASQSHGFGLFSLRERLSFLGGDFEVESEPGRGTVVTLAAPIAASKRRRR